VSDELIAAGQRALREVWPQVTLRADRPLEGSDRASVVRALAEGGAAGSVIVKVHREPQVREPAALQALGLLLAASTQPPGVVMTDLGSGGSLADALLGDDPEAAREGVVSWAAAMQRLGQTATGDFTRALEQHATRLGQDVPVLNDMPAALARAAELLVVQLPRLGVTPSAAALDELREVDAALTQRLALTPSDACPDNNVRTPDGLVLLDFEGAQVRPVAWDAAYLRVPWPSCWCSWLLPADVAGDGLRAFGYDDRADLDRASLGWALLSSAWFLDRALGEDHTHPGTPTRRAMLRHRLAAGADDLPHLTDLAAEVRAATFSAWGSVPLELAPAFR
jgi:hypothetical protein